MDHRKRIRTLGSLAVLTFVGSGGAHAAEAFSADSKWMTGDWGGTRTELLEKGYDFTLDYVGEVAGNLHGGYNDDKTVRYSDQFALGAHGSSEDPWLARRRIQAGNHRTKWSQPVQRPHQ